METALPVNLQSRDFVINEPLQEKIITQAALLFCVLFLFVFLCVCFLWGIVRLFYFTVRNVCTSLSQSVVCIHVHCQGRQTCIESKIQYTSIKLVSKCVFLGSFCLCGVFVILPEWLQSHNLKERRCASIQLLGAFIFTLIKVRHPIRAYMLDPKLDTWGHKNFTFL